jgi:hypothetical protein
MLAVGGFRDGVFLVRQRPSNEYILSVNFKNRPSHHLIKQNAAGIFTLNDQNYGEFHTIDEVTLHPTYALLVLLSQLIKALHNPMRGWPVVLTVGVPPNGFDEDELARRLSEESGEPVTVTASMPPMAAYIHDSIPREDAESLC